MNEPEEESGRRRASDHQRDRDGSHQVVTVKRERVESSKVGNDQARRPLCSRGGDADHAHRAVRAGLQVAGEIVVKDRANGEDDGVQGGSQRGSAHQRPVTRTR